MIGIIIRYLLLTLFIFALTIGYFFTETTSGLQLGLQFAATYLPGKLRIEKLQGKLLSGLHCENIAYENDTTHITIDSLDFQWNPIQLLNHIVDIKRLSINNITIKTASNSNQSDPATNLNSIQRILRHLLARNVEITHLVLIQNQTTDLNIRLLRLEQNDNTNAFFIDGILKGYPLYGSIKVKLQKHAIQIEEAKLLIANSKVNLTGKVADNWEMHWDISLPDINKLYANGHGNFSSTGNITGPRLTPTIQATFQGNQIVLDANRARELRGEINATFKPNTPSFLTLKARDIKLQDYQLKQIQLGFFGSLTESNNNYLTTFNIAINKKNYSNITVAIPTSTTLDNYRTQPLNIKLKFNAPDLNEFAVYVPNTKNLGGKIFGTLEFTGDLEKMTATGDVNLMNGTINIPKLGITLRNIHFHAYGTQTKLLTYKGVFESNTGSAELQGTTNLAEKDFPTNLTLDGKNLQVANLPEYKIWVNPNLKIQLTDQTINIGGSLTIPTAKISPKDFRTTVSLPSDVVFVGQKKTNPSALLALAPTMQVAISLGDDVLIHYQDLDTTLRGSLVIIKHPNSLVTASGSLYTLNGTYQAYGQTLKIQEGRLIYTGGMLANPGLNIKAVRQIKTVLANSINNSFGQSSQNFYGGSQLVTVGVQILGTFDTPVITLFSDPSDLTQSNILSYLVLGTPEPTTGNQKNTLLSAASALNLAGKGPSPLTNITKQLQDRLGLSELNVESVQSFNPTLNQNNGGTVDNTSLVLGKEIAHNLYIHSSVSLFASPPVYIFNVQYKFSKHWSIQSETSTIDTGADLLYSIERE
ncbi:MAG: translocation/assembly module TamB domain-containing protein [Gammaproteobacteria bacterium]|nr:translocation/assembly module TamB domain-containing protein [Gammaproteobacteria bacterium]